MSDGQESVAAPAPTSTPEAPQVVVETTATDAPQGAEVARPTAKEAADKWRRPKPDGRPSAKEAKERLAQRANAPRENAEAPVAEATEPAAAATEAPTEQPRDEQGRFVAVETPATEAPKVETPKAEGRVPIPEGHTIRETRGKQYMDELELHELKPFVSDATWAAISESLRAKNTAQQEAARRAELERQYATEKARAEVLSDPSADPLADPTVQTIYQDLKRAYGDDAANEWLEGHKGKREKVVAEKAEAYTREIEAQNMARAFHSDIKSRVDSYARQRYALWQGDELGTQLNGVLAAFVPLVEAGQKEATADAFYRFVDAMYLQDPRVSAAFAQASEAQQQKLAAEAAERARKEAEEAAKAAEAERLRLAAQNRRTNPLGSVSGSGIPADQNTRPANAREARKQLDARYRASLTGR